jgi:hypothetical protein
LIFGRVSYFITLIFICPCIANIITNYTQQDATFLDLFISTDALHVSGGSSAHHQEHITIHTASGIVKPIVLLAAIVDEMEFRYFIYSEISIPKPSPPPPDLYSRSNVAIFLYHTARS